MRSTKDITRRLLLIAAAALALNPAPVAASCAVLPGAGDPLAVAPVVFVGTVVSTSDGDRRAHVRVESVWRGPDLPTYLDVNGSPVSGPFTATDVDRHFSAGARYIFVPSNPAPPFSDNSCSATQPYTAALAAEAPADARKPLAGGDPGNADPPVAALLAAAVAVVGGGLVVVYWLRRRAPGRRSNT